MDTTGILSTMRGVLANGTDTPTDKITLLRLMRQYIIEECSDYNKISERIHVLRNADTLEQNFATSGHDIVHRDTRSTIEHKNSYIKSGNKVWQVNAQITFTLDVSFFEEARDFFRRNPTLLTTPRKHHPLLIQVGSGAKSFCVYRPLWKLIKTEVKTKMSGSEGGMQIDWYVAKEKKEYSMFVSSIAYRLEVVEWLHKICTPSRPMAKSQPSLNIGSKICRGCKKPHRLAKLEKWTEILAKKGIANNTVLKDVVVSLSDKELDAFYTTQRTC